MPEASTWKEWQEPYRPGTFVLWPPDDVRERVNALRQRHDPVSQSCCDAHVTVTQPLRAPPTDDDWRTLEEVVGRHTAFRVDLGPVGSFLPHPCIWLAVRPVDPVLELRSALHATGLFDLELPHPERFLPHMTITEGLSGTQVDRALLEELGATVVGGTFACTSVAHIVPDESFHFAVRRRLRLGVTGSRGRTRAAARP